MSNRFRLDGSYLKFDFLKYKVLNEKKKILFFFFDLFYNDFPSTNSICIRIYECTWTNFQFSIPLSTQNNILRFYPNI